MYDVPLVHVNHVVHVYHMCVPHANLFRLGRLWIEHFGQLTSAVLRTCEGRRSNIKSINQERILLLFIRIVLVKRNVRVLYNIYYIIILKIWGHSHSSVIR